MEQLEIPWKKYLAEDDFITSETPYKEGTYHHLFEEKIFETGDEAVGDLRYYVYDPTKHGFPTEGTYPVIYAFHGKSASLQGMTAISWAGIEYFASPEYQQEMGGAYIICPLANEYSDNDGVKMHWITPVEHDIDKSLSQYPAKFIKSVREDYTERADELLAILEANSIYTEHLHNLYIREVANFTSAGKCIAFGTSAGGYCTWRYVISYPVDAAIIMAPAYCPSERELKILEQRGTKIWLCQGQRDELVHFDFSVGPVLNTLKAMKNVELYLPDFVRMPNRGVYSNPAGVEMGQHCINNAVQCNLLFEDHTPMDPLHPDGVTGWIRDVAKSI